MNGQADFKLSLFGYDPDADYEAIVKANEAAASTSRTLKKACCLQSPALPSPTAEGNHSEGFIGVQSACVTGLPPALRKARQADRDWSGCRCTRRVSDSWPRLGQQQQLVVIGKYSDGREVDMTRQVRYTPSDETVVSVNSGRPGSARRTGEVNIMVRSLGAVGVSRMAVVLRPPLNAPSDARPKQLHR